MITKFKLFESNEIEIINICNTKIVELIKPTGYIVHYHARIYLTTLENKKELISTTYNDWNEKYDDMLLIDTYSFLKTKDPKNYSDEYFLYPIEYVEKLKENKEVINYQKLPFFDDLFEILNYYQKEKRIRQFKI
jgi:hypothetical protein